MYRLAHSLVSLRAFLHAQQVAHHCSHALAPWRRPSFEQRGQRRLHQAGCFSGQAPAGAPHATAAPQAAAPLPPLSERPAVHTAQLDSLLAWRERALAAISRVGDSWAQLDDGPSQADLEVGRDKGWSWPSSFVLPCLQQRKCLHVSICKNLLLLPAVPRSRRSLTGCWTTPWRGCWQQRQAALRQQPAASPGAPWNGGCEHASSRKRGSWCSCAHRSRH